MGKFVFVLQKFIKTLLYSNTEFKKFTRGQCHEPPFKGKREFVFVLKKCTETILQQCRIQNFSRGQCLGPPVLGERKFCFRFPKIYQTLLQQSRIQTISRGQYPGSSFWGRKVCFLFSKNSLKLSYTPMQNSQVVRVNTPDPRFRGEESLFLFSENVYLNSPTAMQNSKIFQGTIPRNFVLGAGKFVFVSPKIHLNSPIQQCRIHKFSKDNTTDTRFRGEGSLFSFSENVLKFSYSNTKFKTKWGDPPDPVLGNGRGLLPLLEIVSGAPLVSVLSQGCGRDVSAAVLSWNSVE